MSKGTKTHSENMKAGSDARREEFHSSASETIYREIFEHSPVSIWVENWSLVKTMIDGLARRGVKDWRRYFERRPDQVVKAAEVIDVIDVSAATLAIYRAKSKEDVVESTRGEKMGAGKLKAFREQIIAFANGAVRFEIDADEITLKDEEIVTRILAVIPPTHRDRWSRVLYSIEDITEQKRAEAALRESEARYRTLTTVAPVGIFRTDAQGLVTYVNEKWCEVGGMTAEQAMGAGWLAAVHPEDRESVAAKWDAFVRNQSTFRTEYRYRRQDGVVAYCYVQALPEIDTDGTLTGYVGCVTDITERKRHEEALRESEARLTEAHRIAKIGHWVWGEREDRETYASEEDNRIRGVPPGTLFASFDEFLASVHRDDRERVEAVMKQARIDRSGYEVEYRIIHPDGETRFVLETADAELDDAGELLRTVGTVQDITERKEAEQRAQYLAYHDGLTDLPNRNLFEDRLDKAIAQAQRHGQNLAVHVIDLNSFKEVNDILGHAVGDELLKAVGATLKGVMRATDSLARFGGDEFVVIQTELVDPQGATVLAQNIIDALGQPFRLADHEVLTGATIGISVYPNDGTESAQLLQNADFALLAGKAKGHNTYEFFNAEMRKALAARKSLEEDLARALKREEFLVYYQPRVTLTSGLITGVEALVRWRHPDRGIVSPGEFIPVAETSGLIRPLGEWVLRTACMDTAAWRDAGLPPMSVAVNLSAAQFHQTDLVALVSHVLDASGLTPGQLELEITETMMMNDRDTKIVPTLRRLRDLGIQISVDDFGTGYASLTYLRNFPVTKVKIDLSFVQGITHDPADKAIVEAVIRLGHGLNLEVTAEGVETEEQATLLKAWNCDEAQGYLFSRPVPADQLTALLEAQASKRTASSGYA